MIRALKKVFRNYRYITIVLLIGFLIFSLSVWLRNLPLLKIVALSSAFSFSDKIAIFVTFLGGIATKVNLFSAVLMVTISILFCINASLYIYYLKQVKKLPRKEGVGAVSAFVSGMFGVGCASCGSFLLGSIPAFFGASGLILLLPLRGEELSMVSIVLFLWSMHWMSGGIQKSKICTYT